MHTSLSGPTDKSLEDFWRMVWETHTPTIVMLSKVYEGQVSTHNSLTTYIWLIVELSPRVVLLQKKCEVYWPDGVEDPFVPAPGSPLSIKKKSVSMFAEYVIRKMVVSHVSMHECNG